MTRCPVCSGLDSVWSHCGNGKCAACKGAGFTVVDDPVDDFYMQREECRKCGGTGMCQACAGRGLAEEDLDAIWDSGRWSF